MALSAGGSACVGDEAAPAVADPDSGTASTLDAERTDVATDPSTTDGQDATADAGDDTEIEDTEIEDTVSDTRLESEVREDADAEPVEPDVLIDASGDAGQGTGTTPWRSALYPDDWAPGFADDEGRFLHDFSYAGYRRGETAIPVTTPGPVVEVDVDTTGTADATAILQDALDTVADAGGGRVQLPAGLIRVDGSLYLHSSGVVLSGAGRGLTRLWFTDTTLGDGGAHLRVGPWSVADGAPRLPPLEGSAIPITAPGAAWDEWIEVESTEGLATGDLVTVGWTITPSFVEDHGMTGVWTVFVDQRASFFRREIVEVDVDGRRVRIDIPLRAGFTVRDRPSLAPITSVAREVGVERLSLSSSTSEAEAWDHDRQAAIEFVGVVDGWVREVESFAHPGAEPDPDGVLPHLRSGGIRVSRSSRVTIADTHLAHPQHRGGGGNGYLFEILQSGEVLTVDSTADRGRHNFIQNWGFGTSGCVWLRVTSTGGAAATGGPGSFESPGLSEFHHSLAMANLIDNAHIDDGWGAVNRLTWSSGAGHTATENVMWRASGGGVINWFNYGNGYVIGTEPTLDVFTALPWFGGDGTAPEDWTEGLGTGTHLEPASLYEDQLARRLAGDDGADDTTPDAP